VRDSVICGIISFGFFIGWAMTVLAEKAESYLIVVAFILLMACIILQKLENMEDK
jgi:hypothetical protein